MELGFYVAGKGESLKGFKLGVTEDNELFNNAPNLYFAPSSHVAKLGRSRWSQRYEDIQDSF